MCKVRDRGWVGLDWTGIRLDWDGMGFDWIGLDQIGSDWIRLNWIADPPRSAAPQPTSQAFTHACASYNMQGLTR